MSSGGISWPKLAPAAREMLSFISVPPMSLHPALRQAAAPSGPSLTHEHWMLGMTGWSAKRATACISTASRKVGPRRERPFSEIGVSIGTNGSGTNSVKPPVFCCSARTRSRCRAQCS